ncbi:MAG TPA: adenylyltransferase/cytidyltransferase family protein [Candidatus Saccharimonadales bacterium]|nr:adenylyltransferase/cytidyltransferase family protein [Candidatus Saccharimonadales bacterium]
MSKSWGAPIVNFKEFERLRPKLGKIVATSGGYDPIHPGHISLIIDSRKYGDTVVVIVNGDDFLKAKKGKPFQNLETRCLIVSGIKEVDYVIPAITETDMSVNQALAAVRPHVYTKGGDTVDPSTIREWDVCQKYNIEVVFGVGEDKQWSSSWFLKDWDDAKESRV